MLRGFGPLITTTSARSYLYSQTALGVGNNPSSIAIADLNGDGFLDFAVTNQNDNTVSVLLSRSNGTYAPKVDYIVGNAPLAIAKISATGSFTETDNCTNPLAVGHGCTANVTFTPTANGGTNGSITFSDNFAPGTRILPLIGWAGPPDCAMSLAPNSS